jgi:hypothetical protein
MAPQRTTEAIKQRTNGSSQNGKARKPSTLEKEANSIG